MWIRDPGYEYTQQPSRNTPTPPALMINLHGDGLMKDNVRTALCAIVCRSRELFYARRSLGSYTPTDWTPHDPDHDLECGATRGE